MVTLEAILHRITCHPLDPIRYLEWLHKSTIELHVDTSEVVHQLMEMTLLNKNALLDLEQCLNILFVSQLCYAFQDLII